MNKEHYLDLLFSAEALRTTATSTLEQLCLEFPYCQLSRMLYTRKLLLDEDIHYERNLQKTAIQVSSRAALFRFLKLEKPNPEAAPEQAPAPEMTNQEGESINIKEITASPLSFSAWLKNQQSSIPQEKEKPKKTHKEKTLNASIKSPEKLPKPKINKALASKDLSQQSVRENEALVTETLAKVYLDQGLHNKAIKAYEILSLKYPQKSAFFADRIQKIRELTT